MHYDPIKNVFANLVRRAPLLRRAFYWVLGVMFLREWYVKRELRRILRQGDTAAVWDAGSGFGQYSYYLAQRFPNLSILAEDVKEDQIEDCRRFFRTMGLDRVTFAVADLTTATHEEKFDLILSVDVMEHIADDVKVFRNFARALRRNGVLLVNTPAGGEKESGGSLSREDSFIGEHVRYGYTPEELRSKLEASGLVVERTTHTYGRYGSIAWKIGIRTPMKLLGMHRVLVVLLPLYCTLTLPWMLLFMFLDYSRTNLHGGGLLVLARKP